MTQLFRSAKISIFSLEISNFWYVKRYRYTLHFKKAWLTFWYDSKISYTRSIIPAHDASNKILWRESNYITDVVMQSLAFLNLAFLREKLS